MTATLEATKSTLASLLNDVKPLAEKSVNGELSDAENQRFDELVDQIQKAQADIATATERDKKAKSMLSIVAEHTDAKGRDRIATGVSKDTVTDPTTGQPFDRRSLGRIVSTSDALKEYRSNPKGKSDAVNLGTFYAPNRFQAMLEHHEEMDPLELRALIYGGALPADMLQPQVLPGIYGPNEPIAGFRSVLLNGTTTSDAITFMREASFTNAAAEVAEATAVNNGAKPESALTFEQATAPVQTIAHWVPITRQTLQDIAQLRTYVEGRLLDGLNRRINGQLLNGNGTAPNLAGILNTSGIQYLDNTATTGYWAVNPVNDAGQSNEDLNRIRRAKTLVRTVGDANPTFVVMNPADLEALETITDANRNYLAGNPMSGAAITRLWGLPVVEDENIAEGNALVGDGSMAAVWDRMDAQIFVADQHSDFFIRNIFVLLAETRLALTVFRPIAFAHVELTTLP